MGVVGGEGVGVAALYDENGRGAVAFLDGANQRRDVTTTAVRGRVREARDAVLHQRDGLNLHVALLIRRRQEKVQTAVVVADLSTARGIALEARERAIAPRLPHQCVRQAGVGGDEGAGVVGQLAACGVGRRSPADGRSADGVDGDEGEVKSGLAVAAGLLSQVTEASWLE